jgi:hypothetical protein
MKLLNVFHQHALDGGRFAKVAEIEVNDPAEAGDVQACLDGAWRLTQNLEGSWSRGPTFDDGSPNLDHSAAIKVCAPLPVHNGKTYGLRSSMVGDVFEIGGQYFKVASIGFELLGDDQAAQVAA